MIILVITISSIKIDHLKTGEGCVRFLGKPRTSSRCHVPEKTMLIRMVMAMIEIDG